MASYMDIPNGRKRPCLKAPDAGWKSEGFQPFFDCLLRLILEIVLFKGDSGEESL
jgi:hypothetical protein